MELDWLYLGWSIRLRQCFVSAKDWRRFDDYDGLIGQIVGSMLVQQFGWWRSAKSSVNGIQILGVVVMAVSIAFIKFL